MVISQQNFDFSSFQSIFIKKTKIRFLQVMTKKEIQNLLKREYDTLKLIHLYFNEFEQEFGKKYLQEFIGQTFG